MKKDRWLIKAFIEGFIEGFIGTVIGVIFIALIGAIFGRAEVLSRAAYRSLENIDEDE